MNTNVRMILLSLIALVCVLSAHATVSIVPDGTGGYDITTASYTAKLGSNGYLTRIQLDTLILLDGQLYFGSNAIDGYGCHNENNLAVQSITQPDASSLKVTFTSLPEVTYAFTDNGLTTTAVNKRSDYNFGVTYMLPSEGQLATFTNLPDYYWANYSTPLPVQSLLHPYPTLSYTYSDGSTMSVTSNGPGNPFNPDENGRLYHSAWSRRNYNPGQTYTLALTFQAGAAFKMVVPPCSLTSTSVGNIFEAATAGNTTVNFSLSFPKASYLRADNLGATYSASYQVTDIWNTVVATGTVALTFDSAGPDPYVVALPVTLNKKGWFKLAVTVQDSANITVPGKILTTFTVITNTTGLKNLPLSGSNADTYEMDGLLGLKCLRESFNLSSVFPDALTANWTSLDAQMANAVAKSTQYGVTVFWLIESVPAWIENDPNRNTVLENRLNQVIARYSTQNKYWMLYNEPNLAMSGSNYVTKYLTPLRNAARSADPTAKVMAPDTCNIDVNFLNAVYAAGGQFDVMDMHPYTGHGRGWDEHGMADAWRNAREAMIAHGDATKEIWSTESGWGWDLGRLGPASQAKFVVQQYPIAESRGVAKNHFFYYFTIEGGYYKMYLVGGDRRLLPAGASARIQAEQLYGKTYAREVTMGKNLKGYLYQSASEDTLVAWSFDSVMSRGVYFTSQKIMIYDMMGNLVSDESQATRAKKLVTLSLSGYPVYIKLDHNPGIEPVAENLSPNYAQTAYWMGGKRELLKNPSFETVEGAFAKDWVRISNINEWEVINDGAHSGANCVYIDNMINGDRIAQYDVPVQAGQAYRVAATVRSSSQTTSWPYLLVTGVWKDSNKVEISRGWILAPFQRIPTDWKEYSNVVTAPAGACYLDFLFEYAAQSTNNAFLDDVSLQPVPAPVTPPTPRVEQNALSGKTFVGEVNIGAGAKAYRYESATEDILVAWSTGKSATIPVDIYSAKIELFNMADTLFADDSQSPAATKRVTLPLTQDYILIHLDHTATITAVTGPLDLPASDWVGLSPELIRNPSFETSDGAGFATEWRKIANNRWTRITTDSRSGSACAFVDQMINGDNLGQDDIPVVAGNTYLLSLWMKSTAPTTSWPYPRIMMVWKNASKATISSQYVIDPFSKLLTTWTQYTAQVTPPTGACYADLRITLAAQSANNAFVDDVSLKQIVVTSASSSASGAPVSLLVDGSWNAEGTGSYENKLWCGNQAVTPGNPDWVEITLPQRRSVNTICVYIPSSLCGIPAPRDFTVQVYDYTTESWQTVATVADSEEPWGFKFSFTAVNTDRIRVDVTDVNNGFYLDNTTAYTDMKPRITEIEVYEQQP